MIEVSPWPPAGCLACSISRVFGEDLVLRANAVNYGEFSEDPFSEDVLCSTSAERPWPERTTHAPLHRAGLHHLLMPSTRCFRGRQWQCGARSRRCLSKRKAVCLQFPSQLLAASLPKVKHDDDPPSFLPVSSMDHASQGTTCCSYNMQGNTCAGPTHE